MPRIMTDDQNYYDIAEAIRGKLDVETLYLPSEMADAIESIQTGTIITSEDEGKVVVEDAGSYVLAEQTLLSISQNGTYETTTNNEVIVNVPTSEPVTAGNILSGDSTPTSEIGRNGDIYLLTTHDAVPVLSSSANVIAGQNPNIGHRAFDDNNQTFWTTNDNVVSDLYIGYDFGSGNQIACNGVSVCPRRWNNNLQITDFKVQASNDLTEWTNVASFEVPNEPDVYANKWTRYDFNNNIAYRAWRILCETVNGATFTIFGLQFHSAQAVIVSTYLKCNGAWANILGEDVADVTRQGSSTTKSILSGGSLPSQGDGRDGDIFLACVGDSLVPTMSSTSNNVIAGQNQNIGYRAFDENNSTYWTTSDRNYNDMYIGYDFGEGNEVVCSSVSIYPRQWAGNVQIGSFKVQASNDLAEWVDIGEGTYPNDVSKYANVWTTFDVPNTTAYRAYRVLALTLNGSVTFTIFGLRFNDDGAKIFSVLVKTSAGWVDISGQKIDNVNKNPDYGSVQTISRAEWNALTTAQKQAYGLIGIIDYDTGYARGEIVSGEDYSE